MEAVLFCDRCGAFRMPHAHDGLFATCRQCGAQISLLKVSNDLQGLTTSHQLERSGLLNRLYGLEETGGEEAIIDEECPKCKHGQLAFTTAQLRGVDEGQTVFYRCINEKCGHKFTVHS